MTVHVFKQEEGQTRNISNSYSILNLLTAKDSNNISIAISTATDHKETTQTTSERAYFVLEGSIIVNDSIANKGDIILIPANTKYTFEGNFKALLINSPPFKKENESIIP